MNLHTLALFAQVPKRGSFLARSKENLAKIAEYTRASALNVNGTRGSRNFVFSVNSKDKGQDASGGGGGDKVRWPIAG